MSIIYKNLYSSPDQLSDHPILSYCLAVMNFTNHPYTMYTAAKTLNSFLTNLKSYLVDRESTFAAQWMLEVFSLVLAKWEFPFKGLVVEFYETLTLLLAIAQVQGQR